MACGLGTEGLDRVAPVDHDNPNGRARGVEDLDAQVPTGPFLPRQPPLNGGEEVVDLPRGLELAKDGHREREAPPLVPGVQHAADEAELIEVAEQRRKLQRVAVLGAQLELLGQRGGQADRAANPTARVHLLGFAGEEKELGEMEEESSGSVLRDRASPAEAEAVDRAEEQARTGPSPPADVRVDQSGVGPAEEEPHHAIRSEEGSDRFRVAHHFRIAAFERLETTQRRRHARIGLDEQGDRLIEVHLVHFGAGCEPVEGVGRGVRHQPIEETEQGRARGHEQAQPCGAGGRLHLPQGGNVGRVVREERKDTLLRLEKGRDDASLPHQAGRDQGQHVRGDLQLVDAIVGNKVQAELLRQCSAHTGVVQELERDGRLAEPHASALVFGHAFEDARHLGGREQPKRDADFAQRRVAHSVPCIPMGNSLPGMAQSVPHVGEGGGTRAQAAAAQRVREALTALVKGGRVGRMYAGAQSGEARGVSDRFRCAFLSGFRDALQETAMLILELTPDGFFLGDTLVLETTERRGDIAEQLFSEGLRAISIEAGATDDELTALGELLLTPWGSRAATDEDLAGAAWTADFAHVFLEVVESLADHTPEEIGESPIVRQLAGLVAELNAQAAGADADHLARLRQDELAVLLKVRDQVAFGEGRAVAEAVHIGGQVSAALREEARHCAVDRDMAQADVAGLLAACLEVVEDEDRARTIGGALYAYVVNAVIAEGETSRLVQRTAELLDPDLTPHLAHRDRVRDAAASLAQEPTLGRLSRLFHQLDPKDARGMAFSLFQLVPGEDEAVTIAPTLPGWAVTVLADSVLLRAAPEPLVAVDVPRRFLSAPERGALLIGLAMAARQADPRLIEPSLTHVGHDADDVREAVLVALRQHQTPRIREVVRHALNDGAEGVRMEALRYCVAYRDLEVSTLVNARLCSPDVVRLSSAEVRALCIALGRLQGANAQPLLVELADGSRASPHPEMAVFALHGLRAIGTDASRAALQRVARVAPALASEALMLAEASR